ncbi:hypothetical protein ABIE45_004533 [Methylobacterium sp. OAE515]|uniref:hypothetical protein n=1 Tax=Methylobacterium sp. OAE515 TaxID=2817895 RepID=UPI00178A419C
MPAMRIILAALAFAVAAGGTVKAEEAIRTENRLIANAAYVLRSAGLYFSSNLEILSPQRAVFTGFNDGPVLVAQLDKCVFAIRSKGTTGFKIDFSKLYQTYYFDRSSGQWRMVFPGDGPAFCLINDGQQDACYSSAKFNRGPAINNSEFVASVSFIFDSGCRVATPPQPKPRF